MLTIGVNSRAAGVVTGSDAFRGVFDLPMLGRAGRIDQDALCAELRRVRHSLPAKIAVETSGPHIDAVLAVARDLRLPAILTSPAEWRAGLCLASYPEAPLRRARALFPRADLRDTDHARSTALLLAHWALSRGRG